MQRTFSPEPSPTVLFIRQFLALTLKTVIRDIRRPAHAITVILLPSILALATAYLNWQVNKSIGDVGIPSGSPPDDYIYCSSMKGMLLMEVAPPLLFAGSSLSALLNAFSALEENNK
jgi:hypothetical protein